jgi:hypothetical protein
VFGGASKNPGPVQTADRYVVSYSPRVPPVLLNMRLSRAAERLRTTDFGSRDRSDALEATSRGQPVIEMLAAHLDIVTRPAAIADAPLELAAS